MPKPKKSIFKGFPSRTPYVVVEIITNFRNNFSSSHLNTLWVRNAYGNRTYKTTYFAITTKPERSILGALKGENIRISNMKS